MELKQIIDWALQENCSDIHLTVGTHIAVRKFGTLEIMPWEVTPFECQKMIYSVLDTKQADYLEAGNDLDIGYMYEDENYDEVEVNSTTYNDDKPGYLALLWRKIQEIIAPAPAAPTAPSSEPEVKPVKAAAIPTTVAAEDVKVGTVVRVKGQLFRVIEMDDASMTVVTMGKLSKKDMEDPMAFLAKYFTPEQIELLLGDPELISGALAEELFGGNTNHIVFKAARNLFA